MSAPKLVFLSGQLAGSEFELDEGSITVGRHPRQDVVLPEDVVSRHQATIRFEEGRHILLDEGSTNGTFVNDRKVKEQVLQTGDLIEFGLDGPTARFEAEPSVGATKPVRREDVRATPAREAGENLRATPEPAPGEDLRCPGCRETFRVPGHELASPGALFVVLDESAIPDVCPSCGTSIDRARLGDLLV